MRDKITKAIAGVAALAALALGGAAIAGAQSSESQDSGSNTEQRDRPGGPGGGHGGREGERLLTGDDATKARRAALAKVPGATIQRVETDADGAAYEAHIVKRDGTEAEVKMDRQFKVTSVEDRGR